MTFILGISAFYHDSAAALIANGEILAAAQEERFTRIKHDSHFPKESIKYVLKEANIKLEDLSYVVFYEKPFLKFERLVETYVVNAPKGFNSFRMAMPIWLREKLFQKNQITKELKKISNKFNNKKLLFSEHHQSHAASAFYPSNFEEAIVLTIDGVGEWATTTVSIGKSNDLKVIKELNFPDSLGLLYSAFTYYLGFKVNSGEYKVMGLAPYGDPKYKNLIFENLIHLKEDGSFFLDQSFFNYSTGLTMISKKFIKLFGVPVRNFDKDPLKQIHMDIAASIQCVVEEVILKITKNLSQKYNIPNLCLAGGVALNCVANSKILNAGHFKNIWVQPAAGDAGGALGAALLVWYKKLNKPRSINRVDSMKGSFLGPKYSAHEIESTLSKMDASYEFLDDESIMNKTAKAIADGKAIGWFSGRMEFGPRALGARSIIADPRSETMQKTLNLKIKFRESFRPFAPSIMSDKLSDWFELNCNSPYMLLVSKINNKNKINLDDNDNQTFGLNKLYVKRSNIPAVTHVDYTSRIQTVHKETNPKYYELISKFNELTGCPILVNTSFNVRGEPIVCNPLDAFKCFMGTELDILIIENYFLNKKNQKSNLIKSYKDKYPLD